MHDELDYKKNFEFLDKAPGTPSISCKKPACARNYTERCPPVS